MIRLWQGFQTTKKGQSNKSDTQNYKLIWLEKKLSKPYGTQAVKDTKQITLKAMLY